MTWDEFRKTYNLRAAEKCCSNCMHGAIGWDGECDCCHPLIDADDHGRPCAVDNVCDLWEINGEDNKGGEK